AGLEILQGGPDLPIAILKRLRDSGDEQRGPAPQSQDKWHSPNTSALRSGTLGTGNRSQGNTALSLFPELDTPPLPVPTMDGPPLPHLHMPAHHDVRASDVVLRRLHGVLAAAADRGPKDFTELLLTPGVGARTVASLALVAEVVHGTPSRFSDP